jgi:hypothetical protein
MREWRKNASIGAAALPRGRLPLMSFDLKQTRASIDRLFKQLWPMMAGVGERYGDCVAQANGIRTIMNSAQSDDQRLSRLIGLRGVKATIGSGLLWSFFPNRCVPFDKHTMGYCTMDWRVFNDPRITNGTYQTKCALIVARLGSHVPPLVAIEDLVRWAADHRSLEVDTL